MSLLRSILRVPSVNRLARQVGQVVLPPAARAKFDRKLPLVHDFDVRLPNGQVIHWSPQGDIVSKWIRYDGWNGYEPASTKLFYTLAQHAQVVFDIGAYLGYFALLGAAAKEGNRAIAFEAVPMLAERCKLIASKNPHLNIEVVSAAVGRSSGKIDLYLGDGDAFQASDTSTSATFRAGRKATPVDAVQVDAFMRQRGIDRVDLMKIDTETTEPEVLAGMAACVAHSKPTLLIEVLSVADRLRLQAFLDENDYACAQVRTSGELLHKDQVEPDPTNTHTNWVFYPRDGSTEVAATAKALVKRSDKPEGR